MDAEPKKLSKNELAALRAQAYPDILNDDGVEWKTAKISELAGQLAAANQSVMNLMGQCEAQQKQIDRLTAEFAALRSGGVAVILFRAGNGKLQGIYLENYLFPEIENNSSCKAMIVLMPEGKGEGE